MAELEINLFTIVLGVLILGMGYVGIFLRYILLGKNFYKLNIWDKLIQSAIIGTLSFILTNGIFIGLTDYTNEDFLLNFIITHPHVFLYQFFFVFMFIYTIILVQIYINWVLSGVRNKKEIQTNPSI